MKRSILPRTRNRKSSFTKGSGPSSEGGQIPQGRQSAKPTLIGEDFQTAELFGFTPKQRQNHTHVLGSTGTGKSKFLELLLRQDIQNPGCGVCLIDPHGKLYHDILSFVATEKSPLASKIVTFNPFNDLDNVVGFNPLPSDSRSRYDYIEKNFVSACLKAWGQSSIHETPRIARWLQNIAHTLLVNDMTLLESAALISSEKHDHFRQKLVQNVVNDVVRIDWETLRDGSGTKRTEMLEGAGNRLISFLQNEIIRLVIGQKNNVLDLPKIMAEGKVLLINLNDESGRVTPSDAKLLGTMLVSELYRVSRLRDPLDPKLKPFYVYIDEFAQFVSNDIAHSLEEVRKFKCFYLLAHQHLSQLKREDAYLYSSVLTNCKNKVIFGGLSDDDLEIMNKEVNTGFEDLKSIKHTQMRVREQHIETVRKVRQEQFSETEGLSDQVSSSETSSFGDARGQTIGETQSQNEGSSYQAGTTQSKSRAKMRGSSDMTGHSTGKAATNGTSSSRTGTHGSSQGNSEGLSFGRSDTEGTGESQTNSKAHTRGGSSSATEGKSKTLGRSRSNTHTEGNSESNSSSFMHTENTGQFQGNSESRTMRAGDYEHASRGYGDNSGSNRNTGFSDGGSNSSSYNNSMSNQESRSRSDTQNHSETEGSNWGRTETQGTTNNTNQSHTKSSGEQFGKNWSSSQSQAHMEGASASQSLSMTNSASHTDSQSQTSTESAGNSETHGTSKTIGLGQSRQQSETHTEGRASTTGRAQTTSRSQSKGYSEGYVPFHEVQEVEEVASIQFWSLNELTYMKKAQMKNLDVAQAFVKVENKPPVHCQVAYMPEHSISERLRRDFVKSLQSKIVARNPSQYLPLREAQQQIFERQRNIFGDTIRFFDTLTHEPEGGVSIDGEVVSDDDEEPIFGG